MLRTTMALVASLGLLLAGQAGAGEAKAKKAQKEMTFEGDITAVDVPTNEFTVKSREKGAASEMTFHVSRPVSVRIDGEIRPLRELAKGEHVTVTYEASASGSTPLCKHLHRHKKSA